MLFTQYLYEVGSRLVFIYFLKQNIIFDYLCQEISMEIQIMLSVICKQKRGEEVFKRPRLLNHIVEWVDGLGS